jgi:chlorobactene glucosyltransferase
VPDLLPRLLQGIVFFLAVLVLVALSNWRGLRRLGTYPEPDHWPRASLLLPARDEAVNIAACVQSLLAQDYPDFELLVLDDQSRDRTGEILAEIAARDARLHVLAGRPLPSGWLGKHWACHQLAQLATGEVWLLTDADTVHHPDGLRQAVAALLAERADLITGLPRQVVQSWGERLIVPILPWSLFCFFPLALAERWPWPPLVTAVGQFMLFRRAAYERIGGHAAVRGHTADDVALARRLAAHAGRWRLVDASDVVACRMYRSFRQAFLGFSKSLFAAFGYNPVVFTAIWVWLGLVFLLPPVLVGLASAGLAFPVGLPLAATALAVGLWALAIGRLRLPPALLVLYPLSVALILAIATHSLITTATGRAAWKGRRLSAWRT